MATQTQAEINSIDILNSLLRGELSAVETYEQFLRKFSTDPMPSIQENYDCHRARVPVLTDRIVELGGVPSSSSGAWGVFANLTEAGAKLFGKDAGIDALEAGEDRGLADYRDAVDDLDPRSAGIVLKDLLPAQERTHRRMSQIKHGGTGNPAVKSNKF